MKKTEKTFPIGAFCAPQPPKTVGGKEYPNKIVVTVSEDAEVYAVETENEEYYILSGEGVLLETRASKFNRWDGFENVLLKGLTLQNANGVVTGDSCWSSFARWRLQG